MKNISTLLPREKLIEQGPEALTDSELLSIIFRTGYNGRPVFELAKQVLKQKPLRELINSEVVELAKVKGVGMTRAASIVAAAELYRRAHFVDISPTISSVKDVVRLTHRLSRFKQEHLVGLYLNARNKLICQKTLTIGTLDASLIHPREVFLPALKRHAVRIIIVHNHPSGDTDPSREDIKITKQLLHAGKLLGIELIDHVIISQHNYYSFREKRVTPSITNRLKA